MLENKDNEQDFWSAPIQRAADTPLTDTVDTEQDFWSSGVETPEYFDVNLGEGATGQATFIDADTLEVITGDGTTHSVRFGLADAGERTKLTGGYLQSGSNVGNKQTKVLQDLAKQGKFNNLKLEGNKGAYGREIGTLTNTAGVSLEDEAIIGGVLNASDYAGDEHQQKVQKLMQRRGINAARESLLGASEELTPMEQALEIIDYERSFTGFGVRQKAVNRGQALLGTHDARNQLQAEVSKKRKLIMEGNLTGDNLAKAQTELKDYEAALVANLNINEPYFGTGEEARNFGKQQSREGLGFFGQAYGAVGRGYQNLHVMTGNTANYFGDILGSEGLSDWGEEWAGLSEEELKNYPKRIGLFDITGPISAIKSIGEAIIEFTPQLALLYTAQAAGGVAGAAVGTLAGPAGTVIGANAGRASAAWAASYLMQVGGIYQSMPEGEKDPLIASGLAAGAAVVEATGIGRGALQGVNILTKEGKDAFVDATIAAGKAETREQASDLLNTSVAQLMSGSNDLLQDLAAKGMVRQQGIADIVKAGIRAGKEEAIAEGLQQIISDGGVAAFTSETLDPVKFLKDVLDSAATGGVVGGAYGIHRGSNKNSGDYGTVNQLIYDNKELTLEQVSGLKDWKAKTAEHFVEKFGLNRMPTRSEVADSLRRTGENLDIMRVPGIDGTSIGAGVKALRNNKIRAFQRLGDAFNSRVINPDGSVNETFGILSGLSSRGVFAGPDIKQEQAVNANTVQAQVDKTLVNTNLRTEAAANKSLKNLDENFGAIASSFSGVFEQVARMLETGNNNSISVRGVNAEALRDPHNFMLERMIAADTPDRIDEITNRLSGQTFSTTAGNKYRVSADDARGIAERLSKRSLTPDDRQTLRSSGFLKTLKPADINDHAFSEMAADLRQISSLAPVYKTYGENGEVLLKTLNDGLNVRKDIDQVTYNEYVAQAQSIFAANTNQYQNWNSKVVSNIQSAAMTYSFVKVFDGGIFAQGAEMMYATLAMDKKMWPRYFGKSISAFVKDLGIGARDTTSTIAKHKVKKFKPQSLEERLQVEQVSDADMAEVLGLVGSGQNLAAQSGASSGNRANQAMSNFILAFGFVRSFTNANRVGVAANALDLNKPHLDAVAKYVSTGVATKASVEGARILREYGVDPILLVNLSNKLPVNVGNPSMQDMLSGLLTIDTPTGQEKVSISNFLSPEEQAALTEQMGQIVVGTSDTFAARPGVNDVPLAYAGEKFAGPLQYTKFIAYTTANTIPAMWKSVTSGSASPGMTYQAFQMVAMAMATAYLAQAIKDSLFYGETPGWIEDEDDDFWSSATFRAADYTGFFGTPGIFMGHVNGLLKAPQGKDNPGAELLGEILQIPPAVSIIAQDIKRLNRDTPEGITRIVPFFGDNYKSKQWIYHQLGGEKEKI